MSYFPNKDFLKELQDEDADYTAGLKTCADDIRERAYYVKHSIMPNKEHSAVEVVTDGDEVYVTNTDYGAHLDEYGSSKNPAYSPMRTAVNAAGLRLNEESK